MSIDLTTVSTHYAVLHHGEEKMVLDELQPDTDYQWQGFQFRTLPNLGRELSRFTTVNDVHFGETNCGVTHVSGSGPIYQSELDDPHPEFMSRGAVEEMQKVRPDAVLVKGDLTTLGTEAEFQRFLDCYHSAFREKLFYVTGNHDAYHDEPINSGTASRIDLDGATLAMIDTVRPGLTGGTCYQRDLDWLDALAQSTTQPILVFGHHQLWDPATPHRSKDYFGIQPDESEELISLFARRPSLRGYFSGHTHRNRVRRFEQSGNRPWVEVACVKDFPGSWAEYRVFDGGILQIHHRISTPQALAWTEKTRDMYNGTYFEYAFGQLSDRCFVVTRN
jgi:3',5'-cyclic-AMP phosphodiesterase